MLKEIQPNIWIWAVYQKEKGYNFNGTVVSDGQRKVIIDPVPTEDGQLLEELEKFGPFEAIYLTNKDHERFSHELRTQWGTPIWIHEYDKEALKEKADHTFQEGDELACGLKVIHLENQKSPGESAFYLEARKILIVGDALIGRPPGSFMLLPAVKYQDIEKARKSLKRLQDFSVSAVLVGDGEPVLGGADRAFETFFSETASA